MWTYEAGGETAASAEAVWQLWADVDTWPTWNRDIKRISIDGPFAAGGRVSMTRLDQDPIERRIIETVENELFVDEAAIGDIVIRTFTVSNRRVKASGGSSTGWR